MLDRETKRWIEGGQNQIDLFSPIGSGESSGQRLFIAWSIKTQRVKIFNIEINRTSSPRTNSRFHRIKIA